ncbi:MAG: DUF2975 domain-containing protein [Pontiellaceae bacterium]|nr:DUF2975 domain-containing protein [Pontiellaceae bacterium]
MFPDGNLAEKGDHMDNAENIKVVSHRLKLVCTCIIVILPVLSAAFWIFFNRVITAMPIPLPAPVNGPLPALSRLLAFVVGMLPLSAILLGLANLARLFSLYERGHIFTEENVACYRRLGRLLLLWVALGFISRILMCLALTLHNPPGQRMLAISLQSSDFVGLFVGFTILTIAWVMDEARKLKDDLELIL